MGCDIHLYSETRQNGGAWVCNQAEQATRETEDYGDGPFEHLDIPRMEGRSSRDYWLFGMLNTGVRTTWAWGFPYRDEFPAESSELLAELKKQEGEDAHSCSYLTVAELKDKVAELKLKRAEYLINPPEQTQWAEAVPYHIDKLEGLISEFDPTLPDKDQRIVFWFDN
jgi:hypothetical protein